MKDKEE